jgi:hypothetical protein
MRKTLSTLTAIAFSLALGIPAFAADQPVLGSLPTPAPNAAPAKPDTGKETPAKGTHAKKGKHQKRGKHVNTSAPATTPAPTQAPAPAAH